MAAGSGGVRRSPDGDLLNAFALVIYIPHPFGRFLDDLRRELAPDDNPRAHVSVLPPRPLATEWPMAAAHIRGMAGRWEGFEIEATELRIFPATDVIYLEVGSGEGRLREMHAAMNSGPLAFAERFPYQPHITIAQDLPRDGVEAAYRQALRRWSEYRGSRAFHAGSAVLVRNTYEAGWVDMAGFTFGKVAVK